MIKKFLHALVGVFIFLVVWLGSSVSASYFLGPTDVTLIIGALGCMFGVWSGMWYYFLMNPSKRYYLED